MAVSSKKYRTESIAWMTVEDPGVRVTALRTASVRLMITMSYDDCQNESGYETQWHDPEEKQKPL